MTSLREGAICAPTPHDIAQLAWIRRRDPNLAMLIAEQSGRQTDQGLKEAPAPQPEARTGRV